VTEILDLAKKHQKGRVTKKVTNVTFNFTEGCFQISPTCVRIQRIMEEYLRAWNTQENIAKILGIPLSTVNDIITKTSENGQMSKIGNPNSSLFLYNIWNTSAGNKTEHFESFPKVFMDNLLYYHTKPLFRNHFSLKLNVANATFFVSRSF